MKKAIAALALGTAIAAAVVAPRMIYSATFMVTHVEPGRLVMETTGGLMGRGDVFEMEAAGDNDPGDILTAIMLDPFTPDDVTDDIILTAHWSGLCMDV